MDVGEGRGKKRVQNEEFKDKGDEKMLENEGRI